MITEKYEEESKSLGKISLSICGWRDYLPFRGVAAPYIYALLSFSCEENGKI